MSTHDKTDIVARLKAAHEAAQQIPDLLEELRKLLGPMGYDVVQKVSDANADLNDWRNWREGDLVECIQDTSGMTVGTIYEIESEGRNKFLYNDYMEMEYIEYSHAALKFHSRPEKQK